MEFVKRKSLRLQGYDYSENGAYYITICTKDRKKFLWKKVGADSIRPHYIQLSNYGKIIQTAINAIPQHYDHVSVDKYCIMPDHIHLIITINNYDNGRILSAPTLSTIVHSFKKWTTKQIGISIWQKSYFDHIIRNQNDYDEIWKYIDENPLKYFLMKNK